MLYPQKLSQHADRTRISVSVGRFIDVSHSEHSINLQMKTTCYMREVSIKILNCYRNFATWPFSHQKNASKCIMVPLKCRKNEF